MGDAKVLSHTRTASGDTCRATRAIIPRSASFRFGLVGVSTHTIRVSGCSAARRLASTVRSAVVIFSPALRALTRLNSRVVPPYRSSITTMWLPASMSSRHVEIAARPDENANPPHDGSNSSLSVLPSSSATMRSSANRVGFCERLYSKPL